MRTNSPIKYLALVMLSMLYSNIGFAQDYTAIADRICKYINEESTDKNDIVDLINQRAFTEQNDISVMNVHHHLLQRELYKNCSIFEKFNWAIQGDSYLLDVQNIFTLNEKKEINQLLYSLNQQLELDIYVVTIHDYVDQKNISDFSYTFLNQNDAGRKNGNMIIVYDKDSRNIRISTNHKANEIITNDHIQTLIRDELIPPFKDKSYAHGIKNSLNQIKKIVNEKTDKTQL